MFKINSGESDSIPESSRIAHIDVYNAIRQRLAKIVHLDSDGKKSLTLWKEQLEKQGYAVIFEPVTVQKAGENSYIFAMVSPWQKTVRKQLPVPKIN